MSSVANDSNSAMTSAILKRHITAKRRHMKNKSVDYFKSLLESQMKQSRAFLSKASAS